jgi:hypothetical protein
MNQKLKISKTKNMKRYLLIFALLLGAASSWGLGVGINQPLSILTVELNASSAPDLLKWTLLGSKDNVKIYRAYTVCSGQLRVAIKVENANAYKVRVSWTSGFNVSGKVNAITLPLTFDVQANETLTGDCQQAVLIFDPYLYVTTVKEGVCDYTIQNLNIVVL